MKIVVSIMNEQIDKDYSRYKNLCNASSENVTPKLWTIGYEFWL